MYHKMNQIECTIEIYGILCCIWTKILNNYLICHTCFYDCFKAVRVYGLETIDIFMSQNNGIKINLQSEIRKSNNY